MSGITTHVLDLSDGNPAAGMSVTLEFYMADTQSCVTLWCSARNSTRVRSAKSENERYGNISREGARRGWFILRTANRSKGQEKTVLNEDIRIFFSTLSKNCLVQRDRGNLLRHL
jgi:hypothetical protein